MRVLNLTPHPIRVEGPEASWTFPPCGSVLRRDDAVVPLERREAFTGAPMGSPTVGEPKLVGELRDRCEGEDIAVFVPRLLLYDERAAELVLRATGAKSVELWSPDTGPGAVIRDEEGRIIGTTRILVGALCFR